MGGPGADGASPLDHFLADLAGWAARDRTARSAAERSRSRTLADQSTSTSTWMGLLVDLAEARTDVTVTAGPGSTRTGRLVGVAQDFVVLEQTGRGPVLVPTAGLHAVTPLDPSARPAGAGERRPPSRLSLAAALEALAAEKAPARVQLAGQTILGAIVGCGEDVLTVRSEGGARPVYVALNAVVWIEIR